MYDSDSLYDPSQTLPLVQASDITARNARRETRWAPGQSGGLHNEVFADACDGAGAGLALALASDAISSDQTSTMRDAKVLWVQDHKSIKRSGRPYRHGLPPELRNRMIHVEAETCEEALFALEEGLRCRELAFVIGEITGNPRAMTFTASRRLSLASERYGVPLWLVRLNARPDLSSARMRWDTRSEPSAPAEWDRLAPGFPIWRAELFRSRSHAPGIWRLQQMDGQLSVLAPPNSQAYGANRMVGQAFVRKISPEMRNAKLLHDAEGIQLQAIA